MVCDKGGVDAADGVDGIQDQKARTQHKDVIKKRKSEPVLA